MAPPTSEQTEPVDGGSPAGPARPGGVPEPSPEALRRRLRLICDLADALAAQTEGLRRHPQTLAQTGKSGRLVEPLVEHSARLQRVAVRLRRSLEEMDGTAREVETPPPAPERSPATPDAVPASPPDQPVPGQGTHGPSDPAESLALELRLAGSTREEVERYLMDAFDLDNASEITELVFGRTKSSPGVRGRRGSLVGTDD